MTPAQHVANLREQLNQIRGQLNAAEDALSHNYKGNVELALASAQSLTNRMHDALDAAEHSILQMELFH